MIMWANRICFAVVIAGGILFAQERRPHVTTASEVHVPGNAAHGREIFDGKGKCLSCHRVRDRGSMMGPNLSKIATELSVEQLQKAVLDPDPKVQPANQLYRVVTRQGKTVTGKLLNQDVFSLQMLDSQRQLVAFKKADLREFGFMQTPPMPSYRDTLSAEEQTDLIAYLATLQGPIKQ